MAAPVFEQPSRRLRLLMWTAFRMHVVDRFKTIHPLGTMIAASL